MSSDTSMTTTEELVPTATELVFLRALRDTPITPTAEDLALVKRLRAMGVTAEETIRAIAREVRRKHEAGLNQAPGANGDDDRGPAGTVPGLRETLAECSTAEIVANAVALVREQLEAREEHQGRLEDLEVMESVLRERERDDDQEDDDDQGEDDDQEQERAKAGAKAERLDAVMRDWHETPAHPRTARRLERPPAPLYRGMMTFQAPENGVAEPERITVETVVSHEYLEGTLDLVEMPEYRQAGWQGHTIGGFRVHVRVIGD